MGGTEKDPQVHEHGAGCSLHWTWDVSTIIGVQFESWCEHGELVERPGEVRNIKIWQLVWKELSGEDHQMSLLERNETKMRQRCEAIEWAKGLEVEDLWNQRVVFQAQRCRTSMKETLSYFKGAHNQFSRKTGTKDTGINECKGSVLQSGRRKQRLKKSSWRRLRSDWLFMLLRCEMSWYSDFTSCFWHHSSSYTERQPLMWKAAL